METRSRKRKIVEEDDYTLTDEFQSLPKQIQFNLMMARDEIFKTLISSAVNKISYMSCPQGTVITEDMCREYKRKYDKDRVNKIVQQSIAHNSVCYAAEVRDVTRNVDHSYSNSIGNRFKPSDQKQSGRCWLFSGLNYLRLLMPKELDLPSDFEFSGAHLFFHDKFERCNFFLEQMITLRDISMNDMRLFMLNNTNHTLDDGGTWHFFTNLVNKYGVMPKTNYDECMNTIASEEMNTFLQLKLAEFTHYIRTSNKSDEELREGKNVIVLPEIYKLLVSFMGEPPKTFNWKYMTKTEEQYHCMKGVTPLEFYDKFYKDVNLDTKLVLTHDPRHENDDYHTYTIDHFGNIVGGDMSRHIKVPMDVLKKCTAESLINEEAVWFDCDINQCNIEDKQLLDDKGVNYELALNTRFRLSKEDRVRYFMSSPAHAMLLTGVDIDEDKEDIYIKWQIENSWGGFVEVDKDFSHIQMSDSWFSEYVFSCVVDRKYIPDEILEEIDSNRDIVKLPFNDPFGAVARHLTM